MKPLNNYRKYEISYALDVFVRYSIPEIVTVKEQVAVFPDGSAVV